MWVNKYEEFYLILNKIQNSVKNYNVDFVIRTTKCKLLPSGIECGGFFTDSKEYSKPRLELMITDNLDITFETLIHEYCHLLQWNDYNSGLPAGIYWKNHIEYDFRDQGKEPFDVIQKWLNGKDYDFQFITDCVRLAQNLEIDCERRTNKLIVEWDIKNLCANKHAQNANSYLYFYSYMLKNRNWYDDIKAPYLIPEIVELMDTKISDNNEEYYNIPTNIITAFTKYYI